MDNSRSRVISVHSPAPGINSYFFLNDARSILKVHIGKMHGGRKTNTRVFEDVLEVK